MAAIKLRVKMLKGPEYFPYPLYVPLSCVCVCVCVCVYLFPLEGVSEVLQPQAF